MYRDVTSSDFSSEREKLYREVLIIDSKESASLQATPTLIKNEMKVRYIEIEVY